MLVAVGNDERVLAEVGDELLRWLAQTYVQPEVDRRVRAGSMEEGALVHRAQVLFFVDKPAEVRLNSEVVGQMQARAARPIKSGQTVTVDDISEIVSYELEDEDLDAAHYTMFRVRDRWSLSFDGRYNRARAAGLITIADEFVTAAAHALESGHMRAFSENAFAAAELLANSELLPLPDDRIGEGGHSLTHSLYNLWTRLGNTEKRFADLLNSLGDRRSAARYARREFSLGTDAAAEQLVVLRAMREHAVARNQSSADDFSFNLVAHRDLRRGEVIEAPDGGAIEMLGGGRSRARRASGD